MPTDYGISTQPPYKPVYNSYLVEQLIKQYRKAPSTFNDELVAQLEQDATHYGITFQRSQADEEFKLLETAKQLGSGFMSGFTTLHIGDEPRNAAERIANSVGHLAGFVGFVPAGAIGMVTKSAKLYNAAKWLQRKSIPMLAADKLTKKVGEVGSKALKQAVEGRAGAMTSVAKFLDKPNVKSLMHDSFHLGAAMSVSSWQGGVDEMMKGFIGGAQTGAAFRLIANAVKFPGGDLPKFGSTFFQSKDKLIPQMTQGQQATVLTRTMASSLYTGLPATARGATSPEQIYEYLLGAYFGVKMAPTEQTNRDRFIVKVAQAETQEGKVPIPEMTEGWDKLSTREQKLVNTEMDRILGPEKRQGILTNWLWSIGGGPIITPEKGEIQLPVEFTEPKNTEQDAVLDKLTRAEDIPKETWKTLSKEDKIYYSQNLDPSRLQSYFTYEDLTNFNGLELTAIAEQLKVRSRKSHSTEDIIAEIMFSQAKVREKEVLNIKVDDDAVVSEHPDTGEPIVVPHNLQTWVQGYMPWLLTDSKGGPLSPHEARHNVTMEAHRLKTLLAKRRSEEADAAGVPEEARYDIEQIKVDFREFIEDIEQAHGHTLSDEAIQRFNQYLTARNQTIQAAFVNMDINERGKQKGLNLYVNLLATDGNPVNTVGNSKRMRIPSTRMDKLWAMMNPNTDKPAYYIADNFLVPTTKYKKQTDIFRYKEELERRFGAEEGARMFDTLMWRLMNQMEHQMDEPATVKVKNQLNPVRDPEKLDTYYFGGAGDKERAFFIKHHPTTSKKGGKDLNEQLSSIKSILGTETTVNNIYAALETAFVNKYKADLSSKTDTRLRNYYRRAFVSNFYWDMAMNGFNPDPTSMKASAFKKEMMKSVQAGMISDPKGYNKRAQIWFTNGYVSDAKELNSYLDKDGKLVPYENSVGEMREGIAYKIIEDADSAEIRKLRNMLGDKADAIMYAEATDGAIITRDDYMFAQSKEAGMPEAEKQGQSKSFIVSPNAKEGALLGKYMMHTAGATLSKAMKEEGLHWLVYKSAAKQSGTRQIGDYTFINGKLKFTHRPDDKQPRYIVDGLKTYHVQPEEIHTVYSELQNRHMIQPARIPAQMFSNATTSTFHTKVGQEVFDDMSGTLIEESYKSTPYGAKVMSDYLSEPSSFKAQEEVLNNLDNISTAQILNTLQRKGHEAFADRIYEKILRVNETIMKEYGSEGELSPDAVEAYVAESKDFRSTTERMLAIGEGLKKKSAEPMLSTFLHKYSAPYIETAMSNWLVHRATRPKIKNSLGARMRPYDKRLQEKFPELNKRDDIFYLDDYYRDLRIYSERIGAERSDRDGKAWMPLEELWMKFEQGKWQSQPEMQQYVKEIFQGIGVRTPMDSMSGARKLTFKGFTGRKGHGILLHPRAMRALGGADLDGDKAVFFFGGRDQHGEGEGFKESWKDMYHAQKDEFTRINTHGNPYTSDNKGADIRHGEHKGKTPQSLFTQDTEALRAKHGDGVLMGLTQKNVDGSQNKQDKGIGFYSPFAREWMSESSARGRQLLGSTATMKKNLQGTHASMTSMPGSTRMGTMDVRGKDGEYYLIDFKETATVDKDNIAAFRELARASIALPSDPMDEIGIARRKQFFNILYNSLFNLKIDKIHNAKGEVVSKEHKNKKGEIVVTPPDAMSIDAKGKKQKGYIDDLMYDLKNGGLYKDFSDANSAYYGRNWLDGRRHTLAERRRLASNLADLPPDKQTTILPKISAVLKENRYYDNMLHRIDLDKLQELYYEYEKELGTDAFKAIRRALERKTMKVPGPKPAVYGETIWKSNKLLPRIIQFARDGKPLWYAENIEELIKSTTGGVSSNAFINLFRDTAPYRKYYKLGYTGREHSFLELVNRAERATHGIDKVEFRRRMVDEALEQANHFVMQDLKDMVSARRMADAMKKGNIDVERAQEITEKAANIRSNGMNLMKANKKYVSEVEEHKDGLEAEKEEITKLVMAGESPSRASTQTMIDREILLEKSKLNSEHEVTLFEEFLEGSLFRSNLEKLKEIEESYLRGEGGKEGNRTMTEDLQRWFDNEKMGTAGSSMNRFAMGSHSVSDKTIEGAAQDFNKLFNRSIDAISLKEQAKIRAEAESEPKSQKIDGVDVNTLEDPFEGLRGLKKGKLNNEEQLIFDELEDHIGWAHNTIGVNLQEMAAGILSRRPGGEKALDAMTLEDWRVVTRYMRDLRTGDMFDKSIPGVPQPISKWWYNLFPEAINRKLMKADIDWALQRGMLLGKDGIRRPGMIAKPTHVMQKLNEILSHTTEYVQRMSDREIKLWSDKAKPYYEGVPEGQMLWEIAVRHTERGIGEVLLKRANLLTDPAAKAQSRKQAEEYFKQYNMTMKKYNWDDLRERVFDNHTLGKKLKGEDYVKEIDNLLTEQAEHVKVWMNGSEKFKHNFYKKDKHGEIVFFDNRRKKLGDEQMDLPKFLEYVNDKLLKGEEIPPEIGLTNMNKLIKQFQYEQSPAEYKRTIGSRVIEDIGTLPTKHYWPHLMFDKAEATKSLNVTLQALMEKKGIISDKSLQKQLQKLIHQHHTLTGDWEFNEMKNWHMYDDLMGQVQLIANEAPEVTLADFSRAAQTRSAQERSLHLSGWSVEPRVMDKHIRALAGAFNRAVGQITARSELAAFVKKKGGDYGEDLMGSYERFFNLYINNASGYPAILPQSYLEDPLLNVKGTMYAWWADNNVKKKLDGIYKRFNIDKRNIPEEFKGVDMKTIRDMSNLEAKFQMASLLFHPKSAMGNLYGGTALTVQSTGTQSFMQARDINWLKSNLNRDWNNPQDVRAFVEGLGVVPEMILHEAGINPVARSANVQRAIQEAIKVIQKDPQVSDKTLLGVAREYGLTEAMWNKAAYFMKISERVLRSQSYMAHLVQAWKGYNGALPYNHPILLEHARRGVKATQFLYNAPNRPLFSQTSLGKVMSRFQLWSWNSVRFRNDVLREANIYGWREGTPEFERYRRTAQADMMMLALSSVFMYSIFEAALPAPWNWFQDTADWIFGDEKERDRAFFGAWPSGVAPLQMITPPILRVAPATFRGLVDEDWSKLSDYVIWTMFPFGRMARDIAGPGNMVENPVRAVEKITGLPYMQFQRVQKEERDKEKHRTKGILGW